MSIGDAVIFGIVEGVTEFLPVSSTFHLIWTSTLLGIEQTAFQTLFEVAIQAGAILAVLGQFIRTIRKDFSILTKVIVAFIPTGIIGLVAYDTVKELFFTRPLLQLAVFGIMGVIFIVFERFKTTPSNKSLTNITYKEAILVGIVQSFAIIPGVSRAGAVILILMALSMKREDAAKFSFYLAIPTILSASLYDIVKSRSAITSSSDILLLAVGLLVAFIASRIVIRWFLSYLSSHTIAVFGWYRIILLATILIFGGMSIAPVSDGKLENTPSPTSSSASQSDSPAVETAVSFTTSPTPRTVHEPVQGTRDRITKKPFGIYITPETSPVENDRFSGYHTGIDIEYEDIAGDVPVYAIADGTVRLARIASGYGGVVAIEHIVNGETVIGIYGHVDPASLPRTGATVKAGEKIGILGDGGTRETDGERKHLHFGIVKGSKINLLGYVQSQTQLSGWIDPTTILPCRDPRNLP
jgi:undecaprenyl-diphosphatase